MDLGQDRFERRVRWGQCVYRESESKRMLRQHTLFYACNWTQDD